MKNLVIIIYFLCSGLLSAQEQITFIHEAQDHAKQNNLKILMVFSGSDWCKPCIQFKKDILNSERFKEYKQNRILELSLDFPYKKKNALSQEQLKHNERLADQFNPDGTFPRIVLLNSEVEQIGDLKYRKGMSTTEFIEDISVLLDRVQ